MTTAEIIGVIPAAGFATRLQPLRRSKEMLDVAGAPLIDQTIRRMRAAPCKDLRVVTRAEKHDVIRHARERGATVVVGEPRTVCESLSMGLEGVPSDAVALIGFPDTVWEPADGFARLCAELCSGADVALGLFRTPEPERCDVVLLDQTGNVASILVKPRNPPSDLIWGCAAAKVAVLDELREFDEPGLFFEELCERAKVVGVALGDFFVDLGTSEALEAFGVSLHERTSPTSD